MRQRNPLRRGLCPRDRRRPRPAADRHPGGGAPRRGGDAGFRIVRHRPGGARSAGPGPPPSVVRPARGRGWGRWRRRSVRAGSGCPARGRDRGRPRCGGCPPARRRDPPPPGVSGGRERQLHRPRPNRRRDPSPHLRARRGGRNPRLRHRRGRCRDGGPPPLRLAADGPDPRRERRPPPHRTDPRGHPNGRPRHPHLRSRVVPTAPGQRVHPASSASANHFQTDRRV